jgi:hypothetical protein
LVLANKLDPNYDNYTKFEDELMIATTAILVSVAAVVPEPPIPNMFQF